MGSPSAFNNSLLHLAVEKLNDKNYREWAQAIKLIINGKGKLGFLSGELDDHSDRCSSILEMAVETPSSSLMLATP
ncbi:hypothetical protein CK203_114376 [Vitis vinifera]|uniref:Retrotransposon Copia-like N-terminal domain-containing protein n=1 Tax=Vitis vinifera TaxID=29760 RepID=A0A438FEJ0_VITVI|nr:hypothetical protein CK203_114376 [Vitis vinifera]